MTLDHILTPVPNMPFEETPAQLFKNTKNKKKNMILIFIL